MCEPFPFDYSIGPFDINQDLKTITLQPGTYVLTRPITFGILDGTVVEGVRYDGRPGHMMVKGIDGTLLREALDPVIVEYLSGDTEHAGQEVAATLGHFCQTGEVLVNWRGELGALDVDALNRATGREPER